jgi:hypothetical protein
LRENRGFKNRGFGGARIRLGFRFCQRETKKEYKCRVNKENILRKGKNCREKYRVLEENIIREKRNWVLQDSLSFFFQTERERDESLCIKVSAEWEGVKKREEKDS